MISHQLKKCLNTFIRVEYIFEQISQLKKFSTGGSGYTCSLTPLAYVWV